MSSNSFNLIFLCIHVFSFNFATTKAAIDDETFIPGCGSHNTTPNSAFEKNLRILFSSLSSNATTKTFYPDTVIGRNSSDTVYGLFMCRGDIPSHSHLCSDCVLKATQRLYNQTCPLSIEAVIWYDKCMLRYSNVSFFSTVSTSPRVLTWNQANNEDTSFTNLLRDTMNQTADEAAISGDRYFTKNASLTQSHTIYCLAQCTQDLSTQSCETCLAQAISGVIRDGEKKVGGRGLFPSCNVRYELFPFYSVADEESEGSVPEANFPDTDSEYSDDNGYISHNCSSNDNVTVGDGAFESNLRTVFADLSSNATSRKEFQTKEGTAYGLFTCRLDISSALCQQCVQNATNKLASECRFASAKAVIWYNHCWLRYSNQNFFSSVETNPRFEKLNITNDSANTVEYSVVNELSEKLAEMARETGSNPDRYRTDSLWLNENQTVYILAQCSSDLSTNSCSVCLSDMVSSTIPWSRLARVDGLVLYPSCILRFDLFQFYRDVSTTTSTSSSAPPPAPPQHSPPLSGKSSSQTILIITFSIIGSGILIICCCYLIRRKGRKNKKTILIENFGHESSTIELLQFNLTTIKEATDHFSYQNTIGKGGFGEVYKGKLIDGRFIAVKRLSTNSKQGVEEFKNEVLLIAKLQHRNLVAFIGFCLDEQEKILIYEYVPNKSLDYLLFDAKLEKVLSWCERYKIIAGIGRGIIYLHEHSRLKVIHRDLKPSNILLDENMDPKISDFGLARIVEIDQQAERTKRIIGTYGYMSPEYAMFGQFSEKSDVYSFGVMVLEIISGKKNIGSYEQNYVADGLLKFVWRHWKEETPLNIVDPKLKENYSKIEVIKCIQIGLLCIQENPVARPTMATIVSYLSGHSIELPTPEEPTFFLYQRTDPIVTLASNSRKHANSSTQSSVNEISSTQLYPR